MQCAGSAPVWYSSTRYDSLLFACYVLATFMCYGISRMVEYNHGGVSRIGAMWHAM